MVRSWELSVLVYVAPNSCNEYCKDKAVEGTVVESNNPLIQYLSINQILLSASDIPANISCSLSFITK